MADNKEPTKKDQPEGQEADAPKELPPWLVKAKAILAKTIDIAKKVIHSPAVQNTKNTIQSFGLWGWLKVFAVIAVGLITYGVYRTSPHWKSLWSLPYQSSFEHLADHKFAYASDTKVIRYSNDLLAPQHFVLINKIVVNIRPGRLSTNNPMLAFDLYVRTDTDTTAVEIRDREKQIQDHLQRFCEGIVYDHIQTEEGKMSWKNKMKRELNLILTTGKVRDVYFKTLVLKP